MASVFTNGVPPMIGAWHHLAVTYDGRGGATAADGITVYIDGVPFPVNRINNPAYVAMESLAAPVEIGREGPFWNQYNGGLDEIRHVERRAHAGADPGGDDGRADRRRSRAWSPTGASTKARACRPPTTPSTPDTATLVNGALWVAGGPLAPDTAAPGHHEHRRRRISRPRARRSPSPPARRQPDGCRTRPPAACPCIDVFSAASARRTSSR